MSKPATADFLATACRCSRASIGRRSSAWPGVVHRRGVRADQVLWRARGSGRGKCSSSSTGPSPRRSTCPAGGPPRSLAPVAGETLGEVELLDGVGHPTGARAAEPTRPSSALGRLGFTDLLAGQDPAVFTLRRHLAPPVHEAAAGRARPLVAEALGGEPVRADRRGRTCAPSPSSRERPAADSAYVRRMASFRGVDPRGAVGLPHLGALRLPARRGGSLVAEGAPPPAYYLTINGAVEQVLVRGHRSRSASGWPAPARRSAARP